MTILKNNNGFQSKNETQQPGAWASLSYSQKFVIITLIFALPLLAFAPLAYEQIIRIERYGTKEIAGTTYLRGLWQLTNELQNYYNTNVNLQNGETDTAELRDAQGKVINSIQFIGSNDEIATNLSLSLSSEDLQSKWSSAQQQNETVMLLFNDISGITREVGDKSYLILDPDLDTYYLMDAVLLKLPENQDLLFRINLILDQAIRNQEISASEENQLQGYLNTLRQNLAEIDRGLGVASENNVNQAVSVALQNQFAEYQSSLEGYLATVQQKVSDEQFTDEDGTELRGLYAQSTAKSSEFYIAASERLELGIANRINTITSQLSILVGLSLISILAAFLIGNQLMRSISAPLKQIVLAAEQYAVGNLSVRINYKSDDETGKVIRAFNHLAEEIETNQSTLKRRSDDLVDKTLKLETISKVAREITSIRDLSSVLDRSTTLIQENFGYYHVGIFLMDEGKEYAVLAAANSTGGRNMLERGHQLKVGETGIVGYVANSLQARIALDVGDDAVFFNNPDLPETRSEMALPLVVSRQILGVLDVQSKEAQAFNNDDIAILQILAEQLAVAIQNAKLFSETDKALETARLAYGQLSREAWSKILRSQAKIGFLATPPATVQIKSDAVEAALSKAIETGDLILGTDGLTISVPVKIRGQVIGAIRLKKSEIAEAWTQDETNLAISLSDQLSGALESARLYRDSMQRAARESLVSEISARITASATREAIIRETVQELGQSMGNVSVTFQLLDQPNGEDQAEDMGRGAKIPVSE